MFRSKGVAARLLIMVVALIGVSMSRAEAITLREIVELTRAGLSDDVLLALIEVDQRVFEIDPDTLKGLKDAGVSTRVIVAIVKSGRGDASAVPGGTRQARSLIAGGARRAGWPPRSSNP